MATERRGSTNLRTSSVEGKEQTSAAEAAIDFATAKARVQTRVLPGLVSVANLSESCEAVSFQSVLTYVANH